MASLVKYTLSDNKSRFYSPVDDGIIDVVKDMAWTLSPKESRYDVPYIRLKEYQQTTGQLIASIVYYARVLSLVGRDGLGTILQSDDPLEVYKFKYFAEPTGFEYILPYFNTKKINRGNTFGSEENPFSGLIAFGKDVKAFGNSSGPVSRIAGFVGGASEIAKSSGALLNTLIPGKMNFEFPNSWNSTNIETIEVTFDLFNVGKEEDVYRNRRFCHLLSYQNTPSRRNFAIVDPPAIYSLEIPDVVQFPACYVSTLDIKNLGNTRLMDIGGSMRTIPEAYRISITFTSLLMPSRNIMRATEKGRTVEAISDIGPFKRFQEAYAKALAQGFVRDGNVPKGTNDPVLVELINSAIEVDRALGLREGTTRGTTIEPARSLFR
jgi:hypothetical protein